jgi:hypothetical protein
VLKENAIPAANGHFAIPTRIERDLWPGVHILVLHAARDAHGYSWIALINGAALLESIERVRRGK